MTPEEIENVTSLLLANDFDSIKLGIEILKDKKDFYKFMVIYKVARTMYNEYVVGDKSSVGKWIGYWYDDIDDEGNTLFGFGLLGSCIEFVFKTWNESGTSDDYVPDNSDLDMDFERIEIVVKHKQCNNVSHVTVNIGTSPDQATWFKLLRNELMGKHIKVTGL